MAHGLAVAASFSLSYLGSGPAGQDFASPEVGYTSAFPLPPAPPPRPGRPFWTLQLRPPEVVGATGRYVVTHPWITPAIVLPPPPPPPPTVVGECMCDVFCVSADCDVWCVPAECDVLWVAC